MLILMNERDEVIVNPRDTPRPAKDLYKNANDDDVRGVREEYINI